MGRGREERRGGGRHRVRRSGKECGNEDSQGCSRVGREEQGGAWWGVAGKGTITLLCHQGVNTRGNIKRRIFLSTRGAA